MYSNFIYYRYIKNVGMRSSLVDLARLRQHIIKIHKSQNGWLLITHLWVNNEIMHSSAISVMQKAGNGILTLRELSDPG